MSSGFAALTRALMQQHELTLRELARRIPMDPGQLSRVLNGHRPVNDVIARRCDVVFGTDDLLIQAAHAGGLFRAGSGGSTTDQLPPGRPGDGSADRGLPPQPDESDQQLGSQLLDAYRALAGGRLSASALDAVESMVIWMHCHYASSPPALLVPQLVEHTNVLVGALQTPLRIADRARICAALGETAGLRAWLMFDLGDLRASSAWFALAHRAADEAGARDVTGWLYGAQSLRPSYLGDHQAALELLERGLASLRDPGGSRVGGWLSANAARSYAALGSHAAFHEAWEASCAAANAGTVRHGMDLAGDRLDIGYYGGGALLALRRPAEAREVLAPSLQALPQSRYKARSILQLAMAVSHAQGGDAEQAAHHAIHALSLPSDQWIDPIMLRAGDVRQEMVALGAHREVRSLDDALAVVPRQGSARVASSDGPAPGTCR